MLYITDIHTQRSDIVLSDETKKCVSDKRKISSIPNFHIADIQYGDIPPEGKLQTVCVFSLCHCTESQFEVIHFQLMPGSDNFEKQDVSQQA